MASQAKVLLDAASGGLPHGPGGLGVGDQGSEALGQVGLEAGRVDGGAGAVLDLIVGTSRPVSPSTMTSGMPPVAEPTTGRPTAMASRLTMPRGS